MNTFKRILVALDLGKTDTTLLQTVVNLAGPLATEQVYLLHVMQDFTKPQNLDADFFKRFKPEYPVDEKVRDKLKLQAAEIFGGASDLEVNVEVVEGKPYEKLIRWIEVKKIDLLVVGHKKNSEGSGITPKRVARQAETNVLFVPGEAAGNISNILVPLDFSAQGVQALRAALRLSRAIGNARVTALHIVAQPSAVFYDPALEYSAFQKILQESALRSYSKFIDENGFELADIEARFLDDDYSSVSRHIHEFAMEQNSDLIVIGAQGSTAFKNLLFGSVTESLLDRCKEKLILVVRGE